MFCKNCGNKLDENQKFCNKCGSKVEDNAKEIKNNIDLEEKPQIASIDIDNDSNNINQVSKKESKKKSNVVFIIVLTLLILVIIGLIAFITIKVIDNNSNISDNKEIINKKDVDIDDDDDDEPEYDETIIVGNYEFTKLDKFKYVTKEDMLYVTDENKENILSAMEFLSTSYDQIKLEADTVKQELINKGYTINRVVNQTFGSHEFLAYDVTNSETNLVLFYVSIDSSTTVCGSLHISSSYTYTQGLTDISEILLYSNKVYDEEVEISDFSVKVPDSSSNSFNIDLK